MTDPVEPAIENEAEDTTPGGSPAAKPKTKASYKLTALNWLEVVSMAKKGVPVSKIARAFKVNQASIYRGLRRRHVNIAVATASVPPDDPNSAERRELVERIKTTKDRDYRSIEFLQNQVITTIAEAKKAMKPVASVMDDVKTLKMAIDAVGNGTKVKWTILGLDRENEDADRTLPELPIREMTGDEVAAIRDRQILEDENITDIGYGVIGDDVDDEEDIVDEGADSLAGA